MGRIQRFLAILVAFLGIGALPACAQWNPLNPVQQVRQVRDGVEFDLQQGILKLQVCTDSIVRVLYTPTNTFPNVKDLVVLKTQWPHADFTLAQTPENVTLTTAKLKLVVARKDSSILFQDAAGKKLTAENDRTMRPVEVNGEKTYHLERFTNMWDSQEAFYGLGQHQAGVWNYRGEAVDISQDNTNISIPMLLSSNGYGIFWNNASRSRFNNRFINALYLSSEVADQMDYYFIYGPDFDKIVAAYRELTGGVPLFGEWAYGYWQCKNRYDSQTEILGIAKKYRDLHIPLDNIVQDWFWWNVMGDPVWNKNYPDPKGMVQELHNEHVHLMVSVWPFFRPGSPVYDDMDKKGYFIAKTKVSGFHPAGQALYDAFNPAARQYYWKLMDDALFKIGVDAWWLDTTEPETEGREDTILITNQTAAGNGARVANAFPLMTTTAVYQGQRAESDRKRVFILSRSAFAGEQRNSSAVWSGDVEPNWVTFRRQIPAGLNYSLSGLPYWTTDIGGFISGNPDDPAYRELYARWFEFGAFCPIFRAHGTRTTNQNELWSYGPEMQKLLTSYDELRYRLMPYIYSVAWMTTKENYTPMRGLVMDFREDTRAQNVGDQYLFGPALMVNPVTEPAATSRRVYLPQTKWYDFWTGKQIEGGKSLEVDAPLDRMPLFVRAGSILPMGPDEQYAQEKPADPLELRIYTGADGDFTLYEDQGDSYDYEKGVYATIPLHWDDANKTLTIGTRTGKFPGMLESRTLHVVFVKENHGAGIAAEKNADKTVTYSGASLTVKP